MCRKHMRSTTADFVPGAANSSNWVVAVVELQEVVAFFGLPMVLEK